MNLKTRRVEQTDHASTGASARRLRLRKKRSLRWTATKMGYSAAFLSDLERGRRNWNAKRLKQFERALA
jgi:hypothetical protein